ncbi:MAG: LapA family protein [Peptostreptococcaceae bacterium]|nr:LapA family protein [Peptostreptococcaceae bacterium]
MQIYFILSLLFSVVVALFAVINSDIIEISYFLGKIEVAQSVVILISAAFGALIMGLFAVFSKFKSGLRTRKLNGRIKTLEKEVGRYKASETKSAEEKAKLEEEAVKQIEKAKEELGGDVVEKK